MGRSFEMDFERRKEPRDDVLLRFVVDGVYYAIRQNVLTEEQLKADLAKWLPSATVIEIPEEL